MSRRASKRRSLAGSTGARPQQPATVPPWHSAVVAIARRFHQICSARTAEVVGASGLTPLQYGALVHLSRQTGRPGLEQNTFAERLNIDRNTASLVVEQLAKNGLVAREIDSADRRVRLLSLTPQGEKLYARLRPAFIAANEQILAPLGARERKLLTDLLIRVIEGNLAEAGQGARGGRRTTAKTSSET
jgi:DNA-binding MarR family transcriptional regulator